MASPSDTLAAAAAREAVDLRRFPWIRPLVTAHGKYLSQNRSAHVTVQGNTDERGSREYNLALGGRRAVAVRDYLASRGIGADRLRTVSYGEERPKHDNAREETRRLNRRAALVVRVQR